MKWEESGLCTEAWLPPTTTGFLYMIEVKKVVDIGEISNGWIVGSTVKSYEIIESRMLKENEKYKSKELPLKLEN